MDALFDMDVFTQKVNETRNEGIKPYRKQIEIISARAAKQLEAKSKETKGLNKKIIEDEGR